MSTNQLQDAAELLRRHYGPVKRFEPHAAWHRVVAEVAGERAQPLTEAELNRLITQPVIQSADAAVCSTPEQITAALKGMSRAKQRAAALKVLSEWWNKRFHSGDTEWTSDVDDLRQQLIRLRGVGLELVDRLILRVWERPVYPIDRGSIRIACRHGWMGLEAEYEEWQSLFVGGLSRTDISLSDFAVWTARVGKQHCGTRPRCDACPLKPLLPSSGPYEDETSI